MCLPAHSPEAVAARGDSAGLDRELSSSVAASRDGARLGPENDALVALGAVFLLLAMGFSALGSDPWSFTPGTVRTDGMLGWVVRLAGSRWDVGLLQAGIVVALAAVSAVGVVVARGWRPRPATLFVIVMLACACAVLPPVVLQVALREGTAQWFYTNDSTYQIEMAGDLANDGHTPYDHDYRSSGLARFYTGRGAVPARVDRIVALRHFPYFPGMVDLSAVWRGLPAPVDDFRLLVALATLMLVPAALLYPGPYGLRLALGAALACNPVAVRLAWFGNADTVCVLALVIAFGLAARGHAKSAGAALAVAILLKQFALAAIPSLLVLVLIRTSRRGALQAALVAALALAAGFVPFLAASPTAVWRDTVAYGTGTFHVVSYGLSGVLVRMGVVGRHSTGYPFFGLVALVWLPITAYLTALQYRSQVAWMAGAAFTVAIFVLIAIARVFQESYIIYPLSGLIIGLLLALDERGRPATAR
jgi:hypothetical protein